MDFTPTEEQHALTGLAADILGDLSTPERLAAAGTRSDTALWKALCTAGILSGVAETGLLGLVLLLEEAGRRTAQIPLAASCAYGIGPLIAHGSEEQRARLLPGLLDGSLIATGAFPQRGRVVDEAVADGDGDGDGDAAVRDGGEPSGALRDGTVRADAEPPGALRGGASGELTGVLPLVPWLRDATHVLVPTADHRCWLVRTEDAVRVEPVETTAPWSAGRLTLDATPAEPLGGAGAYGDVLGRARTAFAGLQAGVCAGSLARAVEYTSTREQFGRPLAGNQGVQLRAADAYMDTEAIRVTAYEAAWRFDNDLPAATHALTAAWWASEAGKRVVHAGQHLHGGVGADLGHPVHRHFLWGRQLDAYLGSAPELLAELGRLLARPPARSHPWPPASGRSVPAESAPRESAPAVSVPEESDPGRPTPRQPVPAAGEPV
ncbi:acyl-CoA dehydrogenase family protein [Streptomyces sp. H27-D2]|uniref:acyl-CoA dehydrogenase family protein n=1 Tax=Streptomyces sp. H27-D2 TaxID=3046304 RepID=UPI002DBC53B2|nr:acyl-CoA dehydrogenase family protein [Streptomyces sp. H27-D2]MEC4018889.1 acyl-CoA dehydrogenase family protein [Streptomyces sp. H27-D2]